MIAESREMFYAVDVHYDPEATFARAALVGFDAWSSASALEERVREVPGVGEYVPGEFYRRELPPILAVLSAASSVPSAVVVDGYVWLDKERRPGLGAYLYDALGKTTPVIGVAKTSYRGADLSLPLLRGQSEKPLFVGAIGMEVEAAVAAVRSMHGEYRIPTLLKRVDQLARGITMPA